MSDIGEAVPQYQGALEQDPRAGWLHRLLSTRVTLTWEGLLFAVIFLASIFTRLWGLGARVMSHDESLHAYYSWLLANGKGFTHNPMMHGPFLFESTALLNLLFGASDFTSRLIPVILGVFITVFIPQMLKPWLGRLGALLASLLLLISPFILYYSRYIRHDILVIAWWVLAVIAAFRYLERRQERDLFLFVGALALMLSTMEISFIYMAILAGFLLFRILTRYHVNWKVCIHSAEFDLLVLLSTLGAFFSSSIALLVLNPIWARVTGAPFVDIILLDTQGIEWSSGTPGIRIWSLLIVFSLGAITVGLRWNWRRWLKLAGTFGLITFLLYSTFGTNLSGIGTGLIGSLGYWLSQQEVARGDQPFYYYFVVLPLYEYLPAFGSIIAGIYYLFKRKSLNSSTRGFVLFLFWWGITIIIGLSLAGEKMPWLSTHIAVPLILLTAWGIGHMLRSVWRFDGLKRANTATWVRTVVLIGYMLLIALTARTSLLANFVNYDYSTEWIDYAHGAPGVKWTIEDVSAIAARSETGNELKIAYDSSVSWPMSWYLRDYSNQAFYGTEPNRQALDAPVVFAGPDNWSKVEAILRDRYHRFEVIRMWWPIEDYKDLTWERIRYALFDGDMRQAILDIVWDRDFRRYASLTGQTIDPPRQWPLAERMRIYVRKEEAAQIHGLRMSAYMLEDLPSVRNAYTPVEKSLTPIRLIAPGLEGPRGVALDPDGMLIVADTGNSRILKLDQAGNVLSAWGTRTIVGQAPPAPGSFNEPWGIAVDGQGNIYVADTWNHRIQKFDPQGKFLLEWGQPGLISDGPDRFWGPRGVAISSEGQVFVTDTGNHRVAVFDTQGNYRYSFVEEGEAALYEPVGVALSSDGTVYVSDTWNMRVAVFSTDGRYLRSWAVEGWLSDSMDNKPYLTVDRQDRVYITDPEGYRVVAFSPKGEPIAAFGQFGPEEDAFGLPSGIVVSPEGELWITDTGNNRLAQYSIWKP